MEDGLVVFSVLVYLTKAIVPYKLGHLLGWLDGLFGALLCLGLLKLGGCGWGHDLCRLCGESSIAGRAGNWALESARKGTEDSGGGHGGIAMRGEG